MKMNTEETQKVIEVIESSNLSASQVIELIEKNNNVQSEKVINSTNEIKLVIDYTKTVEQVIADSNYDWKNSDINAKNFPVSPEMVGKKIEVSAKLFHFNRNISSDDAISKMDKAGYRPATLMELLFLGFLFPELQRQFPIVALGLFWRDADSDRRVPCLDVFDNGRGLILYWFAHGWLARCRFVGVRK